MDGKLAASGGEDGTLSIIDVATAKEVVPRIIPHTIDGDDSDDEEARKDGRVSSNTYHCDFITVLFFSHSHRGLTFHCSLFIFFMFSLSKGGVDPIFGLHGGRENDFGGRPRRGRDLHRRKCRTLCYRYMGSL